MAVSVKPTIPLKTEAGVVMGFKVIRLALTYLSLTIATNFMTQIYMEKVLVSNETPPPLLNFVWLFLFIDVLVNFLFILVILLMENFGVFGNDGGNHQILVAYLMDYVVSLVILTIFACIVGNTMYNKKYFLYKDDGLRSIRALSEIMFNMSIMIHIIPYGLILKLLTGSSLQDPGVSAGEAALAAASSSSSSDSNASDSKDTSSSSQINKPEAQTVNGLNDNSSNE